MPVAEACQEELLCEKMAFETETIHFPNALLDTVFGCNVQNGSTSRKIGVNRAVAPGHSNVRRQCEIAEIHNR